MSAFLNSYIQLQTKVLTFQRPLAMSTVNLFKQPKHALELKLVNF